MTPKQTRVINLLKEQKTATTKEIVEALKGCHYVNEILTGLIRSGLIERYAIGVYRL